VAGQPYLLYADSKLARFSATFGTGGADGKATFIRSVQFTRGGVGVSAQLAEVGGWAGGEEACGELACGGQVRIIAIRVRCPCTPSG
jgi:hypothetical protein